MGCERGSCRVGRWVCGLWPVGFDPARLAKASPPPPPQFQGYGPTLATWRHRLSAAAAAAASSGSPSSSAAFNPALLTATLAFGWLSFLNYSALAVLLFFCESRRDTCVGVWVRRGAMGCNCRGGGGVGASPN